MNIDDFVEKEHPSIAFMFESKKEYVDAFKEQVGLDIKCSVVEGREETAIRSINEQIFEMLSFQIKLVNASIVKACGGSTIELAIAALSGKTIDHQIGVLICPNCLDKAVLATKEILQVFEDLQKKINENDFK